jgi:ABC-type transporter Mla subunit MlaD
MNENKANYAKIGFFVLTGAALIVVAIGIAGARVFNKKVVFAETYFAESVTGLDLGSPVKYRGVPVGEVKRVGFVFSEYGEHKDELLTHEGARQILVVMALDPERFGLINSHAADAVFRSLVEQGLRVKLSSSGVTGLAFLELDYFATGRDGPPDSAFTWRPRHPYIPATTSTMTNLKKAMDDVFIKLNAIDLQALGDELLAVLYLFQNKLNDADLAALGSEATRLLSELRATNQSVKRLIDAPELARFPAELSATLGSAQRAARGIETAADHVDGQVQLLARELKSLAERAHALVGDFDGLVATNGTAIAQTFNALNQTAQTLNRTALAQQGTLGELIQNLRAAASGLERGLNEVGANPAALLFGQPPPPLKETAGEEF